jgi:outer membrane protein
MLKKIIFSILCSVIFTLGASAQKIAVIDMGKIMDALPEYKKANEDLDKIAAKWRQDIAQDYDKIKGLYNKYQAEQVLLTEDQRKQREEEIMAKEKEVRDAQKDKFGPEGALFKKRQELVKPIQEQVYSAIEKFSTARGYDFIFDKGSSSGLIFSTAANDKTDDIIKELNKNK